MNNVRDNLQSNKIQTSITSGSFGEGLQMRDSDFDVMWVVKVIEVCEDTHNDFNADTIRFTMEMGGTQPGFIKLHLVHNNYWSILKDCNEIESAIQTASLAMYHYLCQNIVGSEDHVKTLRMMNNVRDNLQSDKTLTVITSGSFGEGLQMRSSDFDVMGL
ncbi:unnamed protein product [Mytilus edulis]|uniref:Uncharacterized protein n=1 Tax=Mytilus edulis TaxID=6550 RepID=A0A8S3SYC2_MYTED|nr:unnamed protein product [Mytilus edulis]